MEKIELGEIIATRTLYIIGDNRKIEVKIGKPNKFSNSPDYYCPYQFTGIRNEKIRYAGGVDAIQAILLAMSKIGIELYTSNEAKAGILRWEADENGILGFPVPDGHEDLIPKSISKRKGS